MLDVSGLEDASYTVSVTDLQRNVPYTATYEVRGSGTFNVDMKAGVLRGRDAMTVVQHALWIGDEATAVRALTQEIADRASTFQAVFAEPAIGAASVLTIPPPAGISCSHLVVVPSFKATTTAEADELVIATSVR